MLSTFRQSHRYRAAALLFALAASHTQAQEQQWIDLTYDLSADTLFWPTAQRFELKTDFEGHTEGGYYYSAYTFTTAEHGGTHIDAPVHFAQGKQSVDDIPLQRLIGNAVLIDVSARVGNNCNYLISITDLQAWESKHGAIPDQSRVLLRTGFGDHWPDAKKYLGTDQRGAEAVAKLCFPGLAPDAATWLATERNISAVGIDTASIDYGKSTDFAAHVNLMTHNIPALENVANLDRLPATGIYLVALPVKIKGGSGGPVRIVARY